MATTTGLQIPSSKGAAGPEAVGETLWGHLLLVAAFQAPIAAVWLWLQACN